MKKNHLFIERTNANKSKIAFAKRKLGITLLCLFAIAFITTLSFAKPTSIKGFVKCTTTSALSLGFVPLAAGVKGTIEKNGIAETDEQFTARKGEGEKPEVFVARILKHLGDEMGELKKSHPEYAALKTQFIELKTSLEAAKADKELVGKMDKEIEKINLAIESMKGGATGKAEPLAILITKNKDILKKISKRDSEQELVVKTELQRSAIANNAQAEEIAGIGQLATRKLTMYDLFQKITVGTNNNGTVRYYDWDKDTIARAAAMIAESGSFPESTAAWTKNTLDLKKVGDTIAITDEFFEDEEMFASELEAFLRTNVDLKVDSQICNGLGTGQELTGLFTSVDAYTATSAGITDPSIYDLIVKISEDITSTGGSKYSPDFVVMNISDINKMRLKKDANFNYVIPPFVSRDGNQVGSITVIESNIVTADTLVVGDRKFGRIYEKPGVVVSKGEVNTQFTEDVSTLKIRRRLLFLIRAADKGGFRKVASIDASVAALA